tara:strand:- start:9 stop:647 length:639 start_codon:yes stop_codon:yes gene_type:complete
MKKDKLKTIVKELQGASKMHLRQSKEIEGHIDDMQSPVKMIGAIGALSGGGNISSRLQGGGLSSAAQGILGGIMPQSLAQQAAQRAATTSGVGAQSAATNANMINTGNSGMGMADTGVTSGASRSMGAGNLEANAHMNSEKVDGLINRDQISFNKAKEAYSSQNTGFRQGTVDAGNSIFGNEESRAASMDPVQDLGIDQLGMNSLYQGPLNA